MRRKQDQPGRIGDYWPSLRPNSPIYCRTWYDPDTRQTRRESLATDDFEEAKRILIDWHARHVVMKKAAPAETKLCDVLARYYQEHGSRVASAVQIRGHIATVAETLEDDVTVSEFGKLVQKRLLDALRAQGRADGGVKRIWSTVRAAIAWAHENELITGHPPLTGKLPEGEGRDRVLTIAELARLWDAAEHVHMQAFIMVLICTVCRPGAAVKLTRFQCDLDRGLINLQPPGRRRTRKRNPVVPLVDALRPWVAAAGGHLVEYEGRPVQRMNKPFRLVRELAGLGEDVVPLTIRHTMASELRARGVPELEIAGMMGHDMPTIKTTGRYARYMPGYLGKCREEIDSIVKEFGRLAGRPIIPSNQLARVSGVLAI